MGRLSQFEGKIDRAFDNAAGSMFKSPVSPVQMTKRAEKEMYREKLVSAGVQHAPTLFNILVNPVDDEKLSGFYPTLAGEMETYLKGKADEGGLHMDGSPLVRFIVDDKLKSGKFDVIAENVSASIIQQLRMEEMQRYGLDARDRLPPCTTSTRGRRSTSTAFRCASDATAPTTSSSATPTSRVPMRRSC